MMTWMLECGMIKQKYVGNNPSVGFVPTAPLRKGSL